MLNQFSRMQQIIGHEAMDVLHGSRVAVFGIGGVGGYVVEALARSGVGTFDLIDDDRICLTNMNRQIAALRSTVGRYKVDVTRDRILDINPDAAVNIYKCFFLPENAADFDFTSYDYVVDAVDTVTAKIAIIMSAKEAGVPVISCMGCGNKMDPSLLKVADIYKTSMCPLAKVMRHEMRKRGVKKLKVVYSTEKVSRPLEGEDSCRTQCICPPGTKRKCTERRDIPSSSAFVPPAAGMLIASEVVRDLISWDPDHRQVTERNVNNNTTIG
jgi:tRNA A37 threonylcarbamoyladenosine dehydratase